MMPVLDKRISLARLFSVCAFSGIVMLAQGCQGDRYSSDDASIRADLGGAVKANNAIQTVNPWPANSKNPSFQSDGARTLVTINKYNADTGVSTKNSESRKSDATGAEPSGDQNLQQPTENR